MIDVLNGFGSLFSNVVLFMEGIRIGGVYSLMSVATSALFIGLFVKFIVKRAEKG